MLINSPRFGLERELGRRRQRGASHNNPVVRFDNSAEFTVPCDVVKLGAGGTFTSVRFWREHFLVAPCPSSSSRHSREVAALVKARRQTCSDF